MPIIKSSGWLRNLYFFFICSGKWPFGMDRKWLCQLSLSCKDVPVFLSSMAIVAIGKILKNSNLYKRRKWLEISRLISSNFKVIVSIFTTYFTEVCNMIHTHNLFWLKCREPDFCDSPIYCIPFWHHKNNYAVIFLRHPFPVN